MNKLKENFNHVNSIVHAAHNTARYFTFHAINSLYYQLKLYLLLFIFIFSCLLRGAYTWDHDLTFLSTTQHLNCLSAWLFFSLLNVIPFLHLIFERMYLGWSPWCTDATRHFATDLVKLAYQVHRTPRWEEGLLKSVFGRQSRKLSEQVARLGWAKLCKEDTASTWRASTGRLGRDILEGQVMTGWVEIA